MHCVSLGTGAFHMVWLLSLILFCILPTAVAAGQRWFGLPATVDLETLEQIGGLAVSIRFHGLTRVLRLGIQ